MALSTLASLCAALLGFVSAFFWYKASTIQFDTGRPVITDPDFQGKIHMNPPGYPAGTYTNGVPDIRQDELQEYLVASGKANARGAAFTASAVAFGAAAALLGAFGF